MIQAVTKKSLRFPVNPYTPDHIIDITKIFLCSKCCDSVFGHYDNTENSTTFSAPLLCYLIPKIFKISYPHIYFCLKTTNSETNMIFNHKNLFINQQLYKEFNLLYHIPL